MTDPSKNGEGVFFGFPPFREIAKMADKPPID